MKRILKLILLKKKNPMKMSMPTSEIHLTFTMWKFKNFSVTLILREISFWQIQGWKTAHS